ncbi:MAG: septal ring lytic transglycosylase RlpA family protein [Ignavibacteriaceae bacterium]
MKSLTKMTLILAVIGLVGFTIVANEYDTSDSLNLSEEFSPIQETVYGNTSNIQYKDLGTMKASWYGPRFHGRITANGEIYNQMAYTAAHKSLPFGTLLRITNPRNNKSLIVRINDRGPYIPGRQLDLSKGAAEKLGVMYSGVKKLKVEEVLISGINNPLVPAG